MRMRKSTALLLDNGCDIEVEFELLTHQPDEYMKRMVVVSTGGTVMAHDDMEVIHDE